MNDNDVRLARLEVGQQYQTQMLEDLKDLLEKHVSAGCADNDCKLNDSVVGLKRDVATYKKATWLTITIIVGTFVKGLFNG